MTARRPKVFSEDGLSLEETYRKLYHEEQDKRRRLQNAFAEFARDLAAYDPIRPDFDDGDHWSCEFCHAEQQQEWNKQDHTDHDPKCLWLTARCAAMVAK